MGMFDGKSLRNPGFYGPSGEKQVVRAEFPWPIVF
jgi:hypothetical protein